MNKRQEVSEIIQDLLEGNILKEEAEIELTKLCITAEHEGYIEAMSRAKEILNKTK